MEDIMEEKRLRSAFDSTTFDTNISIHVKKDLNDIGSATISPSGRDVAIASKSGLEIIDLDSPLNPPRHLRHGQSWLVADVQWSPFAARENWIASASNQKALVWNLTMSEDSKHGAIEHTLHAHSRAITDINFSAHHPDVLSTCAVDGYVHCWDLRKPRRPVMTFVDWDAGATQVKWNRQDGHILASSHDRWLRIWDDRKGAYPLRSIEAHKSKIYGLDWNRTRATAIVTCSLDKSIKFWEYDNDEDNPERVIRTQFPVWRARHTPFGWGLLAMPQDTPGTLHLYDRRKENMIEEDFSPAVAIFPGHGDKQVKEFLWRSRGRVSDEGIDNRDFQLVSWGTDHELRLRHVETEALEAVGYVKGSRVLKNLNVTRKGATYKTFRNVEKVDVERERDKEKGPRSYITESMARVGASSDAMKTMSLRRRWRHTDSERDSAMMEAGKRNQIPWMTGVKFAQDSVAAPSRGKGPGDRRLSLMNTSFDHPQEDYDGTESLHDEIIRVHAQYGKITFEDVNMDKRTITISMDGPWGDGAELVHVKVTINFPNQYPERHVPTFTVGKTSLISDKVHSKISNEVKQIAAGFVGRKRGCLEAAVCYLLGEVDLQESTMWFSSPQDTDEIDPLVDESSSESEGEMPPGTSAMMSQELDRGTTEELLPTLHKHVNVPLPRKCGAIFANNGKLVCFLPPKEEQVKSLFGTVNLERNRISGEPSFNSFSRLKNDFSLSKSKFSSLVEDDDGDGDDDDGETSDSSDASDTSSSSDSDSSQFRVDVAYDFWRRIPGRNYKALSTNRSQKSSTVGTGTGTGTGFSRRQPKPKNTVYLHDVREVLPAKKELAIDYAIFGDGADVCNHNAEVAERYGQQEKADIWRYAAMLLHREVPLEYLDQSHGKEPILVIARDMIRRCRRESGPDSGIDMTYDTQLKKDNMSGRVKWGHNPLAKVLIGDLFEHFEKQADIQMLAMLSCVFSEPASDDGASRAELRLSQPETPMSMKTPAFSLDYFPTDVAAWSVYPRIPVTSTASTPKQVATPAGLYGSLGSSNGPWGSDPISTPYSTGDTPPIKSTEGSSERVHQVSHSLSTSPDEPRNSRRANSSLSNFARPFSATAPSSPPQRKRPSPVETLLGTLNPGEVLRRSSTGVESFRGEGYHLQTSYSDDDLPQEMATLSTIAGISFTTHNQDGFDDEGCMTIPLLDYRYSALFCRYRSAYAELLFMWGLQIPRLEILKFSGLQDAVSVHGAAFASITPSTLAASISSGDNKTITNDVRPPSPIVLGKKDTVPIQTAKGLDITGYCFKHESRLDPLSTSAMTSTQHGLTHDLGGATGRCERCAVVRHQLLCVICNEPVTAMYTPCLSCGCVTHQACQLEYLQDVGADGDVPCPGGCECECVFAAGNGIVESWEVMMGALERMRKLHGSGAGTFDSLSPSDEKELDWETVRTTPGRARTSTATSSTGVAKGPAPGVGYSHLSQRLTQVKNADWSSGLRRIGSNLKRDDGP
ncbi:MAG: hypothetical protein M1818_002204 [Claussenomyces sp. TS43310]|nr:MAG: hypothetical protein M1818_002204 [Claussenomyces sp. TS43310]